ncbi:MAB_1171c family putative transporter [Streptomyces sp. NEAU-S7GS2]|uniref:MAB_1171c family putative transporter n=1 Tax=Streptomyces sp. NEAU-S7GS2 TaxID=2202000 RepID=UPI00194DCD6C|nr:MAB_1171c family putative transporter [Streptomyces sp. NEAU-S7GS2]
MACLLAAAAAYWVLGRGTPRPTGTWAIGALLGSFALAVASYAPLFENAAEGVVPNVSRLLSNVASLAAATAVLAVSFQLNVTSPALAVLLICLGLTLPAVVYPISQVRRRRWEVRSFEALTFLWQDLAAAMPENVLSSADFSEEAANDSDFLLQRRVIEISDGILALGPYRSRRVQETAQRTFEAGTEEGAAAVEAAVVKAALAAAKAGRFADEVASRSADAASRKDLRADTQWLLLVADAYAHRAGRVVDGDQPAKVGA